MASCRASRVRTGGDDRHRLDYLTDLAFVLYAGGRRRESVTSYQEALALALSIDNLGEAITCQSNLVSLLGALGRSEEAAALAVDALRLIEQTGGAGVTAAVAHFNAGFAMMVLGRFDVAVSMLERASTLTSGPGNEMHHGVAQNHMAVAHIRLGEFGVARQLLAPIAWDDPKMVRHGIRRATIEAQWERTVNGKRIEIVPLAMAPATAFVGDSVMRMHAELEACRLLDPATTIARCRSIEDEALSNDLLATAMTAALIGIEALVRLDRRAEAAARARETLPTLTTCGPADLYWPEALMILFDALDRDAPTDRRLAEDARPGARMGPRHGVAARAAPVASLVPARQPDEPSRRRQRSSASRARTNRSPRPQAVTPG